MLIVDHLLIMFWIQIYLVRCIYIYMYVCSIKFKEWKFLLLLFVFVNSDINTKYFSLVFL